MEKLQLDDQDFFNEKNLTKLKEKFIEIQDEIAAPYYDSLVEGFMEGCEYCPPPDTPLKKALPEAAAREQLRKDLRRAVADPGERKRAMRGIELIFKEIRTLPGGELCYKELLNAGEVIKSKLFEPAFEALTQSFEEDEKASQGAQSQESQSVENKEQEKGAIKSPFPEGFVPSAKFLGLSFDSLATVYRLGNSFFEKGDFEDAAAIYEVLTMLDASLEDAWYGAGLAHYRRMSWHEAIANFSMAITVNPNNPIYTIDLAYCYIKIQNFEEAKKMLNIAEEMIEVPSIDKEANQARFKSVLEDLRSNLVNR